MPTIKADKQTSTFALVRAIKMAAANGRIGTTAETVVNETRFSEGGLLAGYRTTVELPEGAALTDQSFVNALVVNWGSWELSSEGGTINTECTVTGPDARYYYELWYENQSTLVDSGEDVAAPWELSFTPDLPGWWTLVVLESNGTRSAVIRVIVSEAEV